MAGVAILASSAAGGGFPRFAQGCTRHDFASGGATVRAELCRAPGGNGAAVVVLHGCGGFSTFDHRLVTALPKYGIATLDVDYFASTPPPNKRGFCRHGGDPAKALPTWIRVVDDAGNALRQRKRIHSIGVVGWSLGGDVALAAASSPAPRPFAAVAAFSAGSSADAMLAAKLPPTFLLFGGRTDAIRLVDILPLYQALRAAHVPTELYVYPNGSHNWPGRQGALGIARAATFLRRHLG